MQHLQSQCWLLAGTSPHPRQRLRKARQYRTMPGVLRRWQRWKSWKFRRCWLAVLRKTLLVTTQTVTERIESLDRHYMGTVASMAMTHSIKPLHGNVSGAQQSECRVAAEQTRTQPCSAYAHLQSA